jgi:hypothetical protein
MNIAVKHDEESKNTLFVSVSVQDEPALNKDDRRKITMFSCK